MFVIIGILVVIGEIVGGYLMEHGNLKVLLQPAELLIIAGAARASYRCSRRRLRRRYKLRIFNRNVDHG